MTTTYAIPDGRTVMAATTYTGTGSALTISNAVNGVSMQPDFIWIKPRSIAGSHGLFDSVRGYSKSVRSNDTRAEDTSPANTDLTAFNSNGFSVGASNYIDTSTNGATVVAWQWKAGGTSSSNTNGTITSTVSVGATQGFSVVTYTSTTGTVGHGLGVAPDMIIMKGRNVTDQWTVGHKSINGGSSPWNYGLALNATSAQDANSGFWNNTAPTSTVFSQGSWDSGYTKVAYCFAAVAGYSAFGSYTGNGSTDGPFVYTGFRPRFVLTKCSSGYASYWTIIDTGRNTSNVSSMNALWPNAADAESAAYDFDILSNGFKIRATTATLNQSGATYIYACFAENPFKYANAR